MEDFRRNKAVDLMRIFAAFGVVSIHVAFSTPAAEGLGIFFAPLSVPFFYTVSLTYFVPRCTSSTFLEIVSKMWWRIIVPFLAWTIIYVGLLVIKSSISGKPRTFIFWKTVFYGQSAEHLYFLPQLVVMQLILYSVYLLVNRYFKKAFTGCVIFVSAIIYCSIGYKHDGLGVPQPLTMITYILAAFWLSSIGRNPKHSKSYLIAGILLVVVSVFMRFLKTSIIFFSVLNIMPFGGIGLVLMSFGINVKILPAWVTMLTGTTLGIYLSHVAFMEGFEFLVPKIWHGGLYYTLSVKLIVVTLIFILSTLFTLLLQRFNFTKRLFLGER